MKAPLKVRIARALLHEAFESHELDDFEEACLRSAISSLDGALHEVHPPIGTEPPGEESKQALDEHLERWGKPKEPPQRCGRCIHRKWAGHCEEFPDRTIDAHDGRDCDSFERGDGHLNSVEEIEAYKKERGLA